MAAATTPRVDALESRRSLINARSTVETTTGLKKMAKKAAKAAKDKAAKEDKAAKDKVTKAFNKKRKAA